MLFRALVVAISLFVNGATMRSAIAVHDDTIQQLAQTVRANPSAAAKTSGSPAKTAPVGSGWGGRVEVCSAPDRE